MSSVTQMALRTASKRLVDSVPKDVVDDIYRCSFKKQTGVSLKYMLDFSAMPLERQMLLSAQFLHKELPVRLAHRVAELENLPHGLSTKDPVRKVRDWYVSSFRDLRTFSGVKDSQDEVRPRVSSVSLFFSIFIFSPAPRTQPAMRLVPREGDTSARDARLRMRAALRGHALRAPGPRTRTHRSR